MAPWLIYLLIGIALTVIAYLLAPRPKKPKPPEVTDLADPIASAGIPIPVLFGTVKITGLNVLWYGEKRSVRKNVTVQ